MAETDAHEIPRMYAVTGLRDFFRYHRDVYVSGNLLIYYEEGNVNAAVAPDVFVVFGVPNRPRPIYNLWEEGKSPDFVLEITSRHTRNEDHGPKRELYQWLGVQEYWQYDPTEGYPEPRLRGMRLVDGRYEALAATTVWGRSLFVYSAVLGLELRVMEGDLRFHDPRTEHTILTLTESDEELMRELVDRGWQNQEQLQVKEAWQQEQLARQQAEQAWQGVEQAWQQEQLARQQAEQERQQAEQERQQERLGRQRAERERQQAEDARHAAEAQVAELQACWRGATNPAPTPVPEGKRPAATDCLLARRCRGPLDGELREP